MKNNSNIKEKSLQNTDNQEVKGNSSRGNTPLILKIENYVLGKYDLKYNCISNELDGKLKKDKDYEIFTEDTIVYDLFHAGYNRFQQVLPPILSQKVKKYDAIKDYFENLPKWDDSKPDYIQELSEYVITENKSWWETMFKKHLVRMVAQGIVYIPFNKQCLTLVGKQNDGKTLFLEFLVPPPLKKYYKKGFDFKGSKEGKISLCQNFVINLDELAGYEKRDLNNEFKSILTESFVKFRPLFGKNEVPHNRRANFVASTNQYEFLSDETGNVRWLPFVVKDIIHDNGKEKGYSANVDINLVWSQAYHLLMNKNFDYVMNKTDVEMQEKINQRFMKVSTEMELIQGSFKQCKKDEADSEFMTATDILQKLKMRFTVQINSVQLGKALKILNFQESKEYCKKSGYTKKGYFVKDIVISLT